MANEPPNADASTCSGPEGMRVPTFTTAVFLLPNSASQPPVTNSIWFAMEGLNSSFKLPEMPGGTGMPST